MATYEVTLKVLRQEKACKEGYNRVVCSLQGQPFTSKHGDMKTYIQFAYEEPISLSFILENNGLNDALWAMHCIKDAYRDISLFSVWCARQVQHLMRDSRSTNALDVVERFANGKATKEELEAASTAARLVNAERKLAWAACAANVAAWAARTASTASTENAARNAAWAVNAAQNAACAASAGAWAACGAASTASAANAARAARAAQTEMFKLMCDGKAPWQVSGLD